MGFRVQGLILKISHGLNVPQFHNSQAIRPLRSCRIFSIHRRKGQGLWDVDLCKWPAVYNRRLFTLNVGFFWWDTSSTPNPEWPFESLHSPCVNSFFRARPSITLDKPTPVFQKVCQPNKPKHAVTVTIAILRGLDLGKSKPHKGPRRTLYARMLPYIPQYKPPEPAAEESQSPCLLRGHGLGLALELLPEHLEVGLQFTI